MGVLDARVADLLERLVRELGLEREDEPSRRLPGRVREDVELDGLAIVVRAHPREASGALQTGAVSDTGRSTESSASHSYPAKQPCRRGRAVWIRRRRVNPHLSRRGTSCRQVVTCFPLHEKVSDTPRTRNGS